MSEELITDPGGLAPGTRVRSVRTGEEVVLARRKPPEVAEVYGPGWWVDEERGVGASDSFLLLAPGWVVVEELDGRSGEPTEADPPVYDAYGQPTTDDVLAMLADAERFHDDPDVQNLAGFASKEIDRLRALVDGRSAAPTREPAAAAPIGNPTEDDQ